MLLKLLILSIGTVILCKGKIVPPVINELIQISCSKEKILLIMHTHLAAASISTEELIFIQCSHDASYIDGDLKTTEGIS